MPNTNVQVSSRVVERYFQIFVNRLAYTRQSTSPSIDTGRHYYYRPKKSGRSLNLSLVKQHLEGSITVGLYAINPKTHRCKWVAIDADYPNALEDLVKLRWELKQDGVDAAMEKSRRGGHLWIFAERPLLARDCRIYILNLAQRLKVPVKKGGLAEGIEVFPKQEKLRADEFGNAMRAPLGIHRGAGKRFWFYGADYSIEAQMSYLDRLKRITDDEMSRFVAGLEMPEEFAPKTVETPKYITPDVARSQFRILDYVDKKRRSGGNYWTRCPSCARQGRDRTGDNLAISITDPRKYRCWAGCTKEDIRAALGRPIRTKFAS